MTSNPEPSVPPLPHDFQNLLAYITGPDARSQPASTVELTLFRRRLALGTTRLRLVLVTRAAVRPAQTVTAPDGTPLRYHDQRPTPSDSVFAKVRFGRHYFTAAGQAGLCPLDAELSLPARCSADLLQEWAASGATDESYRESQPVLARILGGSRRIQALQTGGSAAAEEVNSCSEEPTASTTPPSGDTILGVQAEGQGVPLVQPPARAPGVRLGQGPKRSKQQEAVVTALSTITPYRRTPQEVGAALLHDSERSEPAARPPPVGKELRATRAGKAVALSRLAPRVAQRAGPHSQHRVALTDGAEALPQPLMTHVPAHPLILEMSQATEYLGDTANALLGETPPPRLAWLRASLEPLLAGQPEAVLTALAAEANAPRHTVPQRQAVQRTIGYYRRNRPYLCSDAYLACGWPMGTGVVEGACRHLVKARLEQSGMRGTKRGAQAVLDLRAVRLNGHWEAYWACHRHHQHQRLYGRSAPGPALGEAHALEWAA